MALHTKNNWVEVAKTNWESPAFSDVGREEQALKKTPSVKQAESASPYKTLFLVMRISGLFFYPPSHRSVACRLSGSMIYHAVVMLLIWANFLRFFSTYSSREPYGPTLVRKVLIHVFYFQCAMCITSSTLLSFRRKNIWIKHRQYADKYHETTDDIKRCSRRRLYAATALCIIFITTTLSVIIYQSVISPEEILSDFHLLHADDNKRHWHVITLTALSVVTLYSACAWSLPLACLIISCLVARDRFQRFEKELEKTINDCRLGVAGVLESYRQRFEALCRIVLEVDHIFSLYILMVYVTNIPIVCLLMYILILDHTSHDEMWHCITSNVIFIFTCLLQMFLVTAVGTRLNNSAVSCKRLLYSFNLKGECSALDFFMQYYAFLTKLTEGHIGISGWKLFYINKQTIKMVTLMIVSYTVILLKFGNKEDGVSGQQLVGVELNGTSGE